MYDSIERQMQARRIERDRETGRWISSEIDRLYPGVSSEIKARLTAMYRERIGK